MKTPVLPDRYNLTDPPAAMTQDWWLFFDQFLRTGSKSVTVNGAPVSASPGRLAQQLTSDAKGDHLSARMFGALGDGNADDTAALQACINTGRCYIPNGTYKISSTLTVKTSTRIYGESAEGVIISAPSATLTAILQTGKDDLSDLHHIHIENITLTGNANVTDGLLMKATHHSTIRRVRCRDVAGAGIHSSFGVLNQFDHVSVSVNEGDWVVRPTNGILFDDLTPGNSATGQSAALLINPIIEGVRASGIKFADANFCSIVGGTSESNGVPLSAGAATTLTANINSSVTSIPVASIAAFSAAPFDIQVDNEWMTVTATGAGAFTATRGTPSGPWPGGAAAASHLSGASVRIAYPNGIGLEISANSGNNRIAMDLESNSSHDLQCSGDRNVFDCLETIGFAEVLAGAYNVFRGGIYGQFTIGASASYTKLDHVWVAAQGTHAGWPTAVFTDNSPTTIHNHSYDGQGTGGLSAPVRRNKTFGDQSDESNTTTAGCVNADVQNQSGSGETGIYRRIRGDSAGISGAHYANQLFSYGGNAFEIFAVAGGPLSLGYSTQEHIRLSDNLTEFLRPVQFDTTVLGEGNATWQHLLTANGYGNTQVFTTNAAPNAVTAEDASFYFGFVSNVASGYPDLYGSLFGYKRSDNTYQYSYQVFRPSSGTGLYFRYATNATTWTSWQDLTLVATGTVTHTAGALTSGQLIVGNGSGDLKTGNLSGDVTTSGTVATTLKNTGPGAGTYTVGAKLTPGGVNGTITLDAQGRVTAITPAT